MNTSSTQGRYQTRNLEQLVILCALFATVLQLCSETWLRHDASISKHYVKKVFTHSFKSLTIHAVIYQFLFVLGHLHPPVSLDPAWKPLTHYLAALSPILVSEPLFSCSWRNGFKIPQDTVGLSPSCTLFLTLTMTYLIERRLCF